MVRHAFPRFSLPSYSTWESSVTPDHFEIENRAQITSPLRQKRLVLVGNTCAQFQTGFSCRCVLRILIFARFSGFCLPCYLKPELIKSQRPRQLSLANFAAAAGFSSPAARSVQHAAKSLLRLPALQEHKPQLFLSPIRKKSSHIWNSDSPSIAERAVNIAVSARYSR